MPMPISKKAEKCLKHSSAFEIISKNLPAKLRGLFSLQATEECIGLYHNQPDNEELILITDLGIHIQMGETTAFICYDDIEEIQWLDEDKQALNVARRELVITTGSGKVYHCPVRGDWYSSELSCGGPDLAGFHSFLLGAKQIRQILTNMK